MNTNIGFKEKSYRFNIKSVTATGAFRKTQKTFALFIVALIILVLTSCSAKTDDQTPIKNVISAQIGDTLDCTFFTWSVENVYSSEQLESEGEELLPWSDDNKFVIADISITNIYDHEIPVGNYDFSMEWIDTSGATHSDNAYESFMDEMYPDEIIKQVGESESGKLVFEFPKDIYEGRIVYAELFEDGSEGNYYCFDFELEQVFTNE